MHTIFWFSPSFWKRKSSHYPVYMDTEQNYSWLHACTLTQPWRLLSSFVLCTARRAEHKQARGHVSQTAVKNPNFLNALFISSAPRSWKISTCLNPKTVHFKIRSKWDLLLTRPVSNYWDIWSNGMHVNILKESEEEALLYNLSSHIDLNDDCLLKSLPEADKYQTSQAGNHKSVKNIMLASPDRDMREKKMTVVYIGNS